MNGNGKNDGKDVKKEDKSSFIYDPKTKAITGQLEIGLELNGQLHRDFSLRLPTLGDEIDTSEDISVPESGYRVALFARCLIALGGIPAQEISYALLRSGLYGSDLMVLVKALEELRKKRKDVSASSTTSAAPVSSSDSMDTVKSNSAPLTL